MEPEEHRCPDCVKRPLDTKERQRLFLFPPTAVTPNQPRGDRHHHVQHGPRGAEDPRRRVPIRLRDLRIPSARVDEERRSRCRERERQPSEETDVFVFCLIHLAELVKSFATSHARGVPITGVLLNCPDLDDKLAGTGPKQRSLHTFRPFSPHGSVRLTRFVSWHAACDWIPLAEVAKTLDNTPQLNPVKSNPIFSEIDYERKSWNSSPTPIKPAT